MEIFLGLKGKFIKKTLVVFIMNKKSQSPQAVGYFLSLKLVTNGRNKLWGITPDLSNKKLLIASLLGILLLLFVINTIGSKEYKISEIYNKGINEKVKVIGMTKNIKTYENNFTVFTLVKNNESIKVVCNCQNIKNNQEIEVIGKITEYNNIKQIEADKIKVFILT